jgi:hypothetical protein
LDLIRALMDLMRAAIVARLRRFPGLFLSILDSLRWDVLLGCSGMTKSLAVTFFARVRMFAWSVHDINWVRTYRLTRPTVKEIMKVFTKNSRRNWVCFLSHDIMIGLQVCV